MKIKSFSNITCLISKHNYSVSRTSKLAVFLLILTSDVLLNKSEASEQRFDKASIADVRTSSASEPTSKHLIYSSAKQPSLQLKHSTGKRKRYRRNPKPVAEVFGTNSLNSGSSFGVAEDQVENSHKPKFESCDEYRPSVREESARGKININLSSLHSS